MIDPAELRDLIREYGSTIDFEKYEAIYSFGIWYADKRGAGDVVLSDWTPLQHQGLETVECRAVPVSSDWKKCERCWNYHSIRGNWRDLCDRCLIALAEGLKEGAWPELSDHERGQIRARLRQTVSQWKRDR